MSDTGCPATWPASAYAGTKSRPFCDVVMKGGVTSGVVYPFAICHIAKAYVIRNIGGSSVGAIAAALTAAAEFRRRGRNGTGAGYKRLADLPAFLGTANNLKDLFAADAKAAHFLDAALAFVAVDKKGKQLPKREKMLRALWVMLRPSIGWLVATVILSVIANPITWILKFHSSDFPFWIDVLFGAFDFGVALVVVLFAVLVCVALWSRACVIETGKNNFGWAHGHRAHNQHAGIPPLIDWLHAEIQATAGLATVGTPPLTLGNLQNCPLPNEEKSVDAGVTFRVNTTCLTLNRPFTLPFDPIQKLVFYFTIDEFRHYFPDDVVAYLDRTCATHPQLRHRKYRVFPSAAILPVVVAARMSMSFPILFSALKLYADDHENGMQPMWFSDGGLTSNMPIHFFDGPLPRWPTFAIDLLGSDPAGKRHDKKPFQNAADVFIEGDVVDESTIEPWDRLGTDVVLFLAAIVETARTWQDRLLGHTPGYSDRTIGIRLHKDEGGLNITMPKETVDHLTELGDAAGIKLVKRFALPQAGWEGQRWTRFRSTMAALSSWLEAFDAAYGWKDSVTPADYGETCALKTTPERYSKAKPWATLGDARIAAAESQKAARLRTAPWEGFDTGAAEPPPQLVSRPKF